jgi:hypothetical protein
MAIRVVEGRSLAVVELVSKVDDALDMTPEAYADYIKSGGDHARLKFKSGCQPTVFVLTFNLSGRDQAAIKDGMVLEKSGDGAPAVSFGSWQYRIAKLTLKDIRNPADLPLEQQLLMKKDDKGHADDELLAKLSRWGVIDEIFSLYTTLVMDPARANAKN